MRTIRRWFPPLVLAAAALAARFALAQGPSSAPAPAPADTTARRPAPADTAARGPAPTDTTVARPAAADTTRRASAPAPPAPTAPPSPLGGMRNKISAGDLLSAESILEVYRDKYGENRTYLVGLSWLARGALLLGDLSKTRSYVADVRARCDKVRAAGDTLERDRDYETALGAAIEVEAQLLERTKGADRAATFLRSELAKIARPVSLRSRLYKRLNLMTLVGQKAPELAVEDGYGATPPARTGQPTLLFLWAEWCADCKAQAASLAKARRRFEGAGLRVVALTRYYDPDSLRVREKARVDSVWKADYADLSGVPVFFSTASMERYGASSTPTFVFVDSAGVVRRYTPTRLTEAEFNRTLTTLMK